MVKIKSFFVSPFWGKVFNRNNFIKIIIIFTVGFILRVLVFAFMDDNVFYYFMILFAVFINGGVYYFDFYIVPNFIIDFFINFPKINFNCFKISSIKNAVSFYFNRNKVNLTGYVFNSNNFISDNKINNSKLYNFNSSENISDFDKFRDKSKRMLFWVFWEKYTSDFDSYKTFKESWDPNVKVRSEIKKDIKNNLRKIKVFKNTAKRIWNIIFE